ncbi:MULTISPECIES: BTAD domain-containing putative transcriptional regulator [unclassified Fusibacter]|uniref:BTAD domain-containing putative transcriptional regulator n=1 Tax=unclassified Fusibacter TaxID=2624464 RepID=UPI001011D06A|nr:MULTISPECIES: BTAD domain-containing putative transcriptional regulator [unclassified Fusibacter]MCK8060991.1 hypothetical protein [Fusibacter sp. A2]NPE20555.1 hypothetical protein [Fusibacter sp. A1]RXV63752.1 hypothetical protein DWB64_01890 [Fusibacter sp. A1]
MIRVTVFGEPGVYLNNQQVRFPFKKAEGLFYYMAIHKEVTRERLIHLFWADLEDQSAKKNLRNALYIIKTLFGPGIFITQTRQTISINEELIDVETKVDGSKYLSLSGEFLHNFHVKEADFFDEWVMYERDKYRESRISNAYEKLTVSTEPDQIIRWCKLILTQDPYDEAIYRKLMKTYMNIQQYNKGIDAYKRLEEKLKKDLGITPDTQTAALYKKVLDFKETDSNVVVSPDHSTQGDGLLNQLNSLSEDAKHVIAIFSCYMSSIPFDDILAMSGQSEWNLLTSIKELVEKRLVVEFEKKDELRFSFVSETLKDFVYNGLLKAQKRIIHQRIANQVQIRLKDNMAITEFKSLIHHYQKAGDRLNELKYRVEYLSEYLQVNHETFPVINYQRSIHPSLIYMSNEAVDKELEVIDHLFDSLIIPKSYRQKVSNLSQKVLHIKGRYAIKCGEYDKGVCSIDRLIREAKQDNDVEMLFKGMLQLAFHKINIHDVDGLKGIVDEGLKVFDDINTYPNACFLRLSGLESVLRGDFERGNTLLEESIHNTLTLDDAQQYSLGIVACKYYLAESKRLTRAYDEALTLLEEAIRQLKSKGLYGRLTVFYTQAGQVAYEARKYDTARSYFKKANNLYEKYEYRWGQAIARAYGVACGLYKNGFEERQHEAMLSALEKAEKLGNKYEIGLIYKVFTDYVHYLVEHKAPVWQYEVMLKLVARYKESDMFSALDHYCYRMDVKSPINRKLELIYTRIELSQDKTSDLLDKQEEAL